MNRNGQSSCEVAAQSDLAQGTLYGGRRPDNLADLQLLSLNELRLRWASAFGIEPLPRLSRELLVRGIAHRIQEKARGGLAKKLLRKLETIARGGGALRAGSRTSTPTGTRLVREWQGQMHEVQVLNDGFLWNCRVFRSLSEIARQITGTQWSGPRFFGVKGKGQGRSKIDV